MEQLHQLEEYSIEIIESFIENKIEESINIEFKSGDALQKTPLKKKEIAKDISAMANANGGVIIYGIKEDNHVAASLSFVDGEYFTKESLEQIISSTIKRMIPDIKIFPIRVDEDIKQTIYVVQIPESVQAPHMNNLDKRFYVRRNFESIQMEEYEIRQLYGRKAIGKLQIAHLQITPIPDETEFSISFSVTVLAKNQGEAMVKDYRLFMYLNRDFAARVNWTSNGQGVNYNSMITLDNFQITNDSPPKLFPNDLLPIITFNTGYFEFQDVIGFLEKNELRAEVKHDSQSHSFKYNNERILDEFLNKKGGFSFLEDWIPYQ